MKKIGFMLVVMMMITTTANAEGFGFKFGVKGGLNVTQISMKSDDYKFNSNNNAGFFIGPTVKLSLPLGGLGVDGAVMYSQSQFKSGSVDLNNLTADETTVKQQYVAIPINVRYTFGLGDAANLFIFAGPQFNFNVGDKYVTVIKDICDWNNKKSQVCVNVGIGATVLKHLQVTVNYNIACGNNTEAETTTQIGNTAAGTSLASVKTNLWQVGLCWWF